jgi:hypothetical protein
VNTAPDKTALNKAVVAVMNGIHRLKKADDNKHGGYKYVSVDDFKDLVRPLLAENGLSIRMSETDYSIETLQGKNGSTLSARITYEISLRHVSGVEDEPERTTIMLPHTGAQTAGAAKSYALKEYLKGRFLVSTGDKDMIEGGADADSFKPQEYTAASSKPQLLTREAARKLYKDLEKELVALTTVHEVNQWTVTRDVEINKLGDWKSYIDKAIDGHVQFLTKQAFQEAAE